MFEDSLLAKIVQEKMQYTARRHGVISDNIAKISTPLAKTKDLVPFATVLDRSMMQPIQLKVTKKDHIAQQNHVSQIQ